MAPDANFTFLIKSFLRRACVERLIKSIRVYYQNSPIVVVDDSTKEGEEKWCFDSVASNVKTINLPFDSGLSAGRNAGVRAITTDTFCLLDDDFVFTPETDIKRMTKIMREADLDVVAGIMSEGGKRRGYYGKFKVIKPGKVIECVKLPSSIGSKEYALADIVPNFFLAKTKSILNCPWDDSLKMGEHTAFFYDAYVQGGVKIGYTDKVVVEHRPCNSSVYQNYRSRAKAYYRKFLKDRNIKAFRSLAGNWSYWDSNGNPQTSKTNPYSKATNKQVVNTRINPLATTWNKRQTPVTGHAKQPSARTINTKKAIDNLTLLHRTLKDSGVVHWLTDGTLLGAYRNGKIISYDRDTDIGVSIASFTPNALDRIEKAGFRVGKVFGRFGDGFEIALHRQGVKTDLFFFYENCPRHNGHTYHSAYASFTKTDCQQYDFVYEPFEIGKIELDGFVFPAPSDPSAYLTQKYGPDFMTPIRSWSYWRDPKNARPTKRRIGFAESTSDLEAFRAGKMTPVR